MWVHKRLEVAVQEPEQAGGTSRHTRSAQGYVALPYRVNVAVVIITVFLLLRLHVVVGFGVLLILVPVALAPSAARHVGVGGEC